MVDATSGAGEPSDKVCEQADAPVSFKPDVEVSSNEERRKKVTDRQQYADAVV